MELKHVIPNMEKTFGNLEFAGENKVEQRRINGHMTVVSRSFNLYCLRLLVRKILNRKKRSNLSIRKSPQRVTKSAQEDSQTISCQQTIW